MELTGDLELFVCARLDGARVTRRGCAAKYRAALEHSSAAPGTESHQQTYRCRGCPIGAAHDAGERPDVALARLSTRPVETVGAQLVREMERLPGAARALDEALDEREEDAVPNPPRMITVNDTTKSLQAWAAELGFKSASAIYKKPAPPLEQEVLDVLRSAGLAKLAERLGYVVEDLGSHPRGRLLLVVES